MKTIKQANQLIEKFLKPILKTEWGDKIQNTINDEFNDENFDDYGFGCTECGALEYKNWNEMNNLIDWEKDFDKSKYIVKNPVHKENCPRAKLINEAREFLGLK